MSLREDADRILWEKGLFRILEKYGTPHPVGSYRCDLMTWEDLDISMECSDPSEQMLYDLAKDVNAQLVPYSFEGKVLPDKSMFYSCKTKIGEKRWNIDIWFRNADAVRKTVDFCERLKRCTAAEPEKRERILRMKRELADRGMYGIDKNPASHYHSGDIYHAVLEDGVETTEEFLKKYALHRD